MIPVCVRCREPIIRGLFCEGCRVNLIERAESYGGDQGEVYTRTGQMLSDELQRLGVWPRETVTVSEEGD